MLVEALYWKYTLIQFVDRSWVGTAACAANS
jgi:hypothetical protein